MLSSGGGRGTESGTRQRSAVSVQARPPFSHSFPVRVACAALCPTCPRFILLGDGRVSSDWGGGGEATAGVVPPDGGGTCPGAGGSLPAAASCRRAGVSERAGSGGGTGGVPAAGQLEPEARYGGGGEEGAQAPRAAGPSVGSSLGSAEGSGRPSSAWC